MCSDLNLALFSSTVMPHIGSLAMLILTSSFYFNCYLVKNQVTIINEEFQLCFASSSNFSNLNLAIFSVAELLTTVSELIAIAPAANIGFISPTAATGIMTVLYMNAQNRLELIFFMVFLLNSTPSATSLKSSLIRTIPPVSFAMSVPLPIAMPMSDWASQ